MTEKNKRGYFGIGIFNAKNAKNIGTLWRSANILGAQFIFTIGKRYSNQCSDTMKTQKHIPLFHYANWEDFKKHVPCDCPVIAIELDENSIPIQRFIHPERCIYLLGAEDSGISKKVLNDCYTIVQLPGDHCMNVSTAGSIVMYDRFVKNNP